MLDTLAESRTMLSLNELARRTGLPRSTVHRLIQALEGELYVVRDPGRRGYSLGPGLLKFGVAAHSRLVSSNRRSLATLARTTGENVDLAVFSGREVVVVDQVESPDRVRSATEVGRAFSLHASCLGVALMALLPDDTVQTLLSGPLTRFTEHTVTDPDVLIRRIEDVRSTRIAVDREEHDLGICAVATAFRGQTGALQAVSVVMPSSRFRLKQSRAIEGLERLNPDLA
ncbi:IclR family transcriptional regulator [Rhodococcoides kroppenstedtii]|uniref:IclR family transcriptional regulator n=1 Tax=Rhodococcoides kroppenstedtii TaxID=293050 RepID=UPI0036301D26